MLSEYADCLWAIKQLRIEGQVVQGGDKRGAKYHYLVRDGRYRGALYDTRTSP